MVIKCGQTCLKWYQGHFVTQACKWSSKIFFNWLLCYKMYHSILKNSTIQHCECKFSIKVAYQSKRNYSLPQQEKYDKIHPSSLITCDVTIIKTL